MDNARSDALVLFGVTGDLAHKMIFPALYGEAGRTFHPRDRGSFSEVELGTAA